MPLKLSKSTVTVSRCREFDCPFLHAGIMGLDHCTVSDRNVTPDEYGKVPPSWCPLRTQLIKVRIK